MATLFLAAIGIRGVCLAFVFTSSQQFTAPFSAKNEYKSLFSISELSLTFKFTKSSLKAHLPRSVAASGTRKKNLNILQDALVSFHLNEISHLYGTELKGK